MIRLGIVGCNYGRTVQLPAFRADPRCEVVALAASNGPRAAAVASALNIPKAYGDWRTLVEDETVQAVAIATMPALQVQIALRAFELGKPVFAEKPMARDLEDACAMLRQARHYRLPTVIDFNFHQVLTWQRAKAMLDDGAIGTLRHVVVHWHVETRAIRTHVRNWKTLSDDGGGVLGNFVSHCFHYLEWFCGAIKRLTARLSGVPGSQDLTIRRRRCDRGQDGAADRRARELVPRTSVVVTVSSSMARMERWCCVIQAPIICEALNCYMPSDRQQC